MADEEGAATTTTPWCPRCLRPVGESARCPRCGLQQLGADAARLRVVVHRLYEVGERQRALAAEAASLQLEQSRLLQVLASGTAPQAGPRPRPPREWRPETVRGVLLWLGSMLVALAALIFAVVAWIRLDDAGRAGLLAGATLVAAAGAATAHRRRLPATGEALGGLALALVLVDWYALRRAGVADDWSATAWWALGTAVGAAIAAGAARWLPLQRLAAAVLAEASAVLAVATIAHAPWTVGVGLALLAAASAVAAAMLAASSPWRPAAAVLGAGTGFLELAALGLVLLSPPIGDAASAAGPAAALATMALAPAVARAMLTARVGRATLDGLVAVTAGALLASGGVLLAAAWRSWALLAAVAVLGAGAVGLARALPPALQRGTTLAAGTTLAVGAVGLLGPFLRGLAAPLEWAAAPWTARLTADASGALERFLFVEGGLDGGYPVIVMLLACAGAAGLAAAPARGSRLIAPRVAAMVVSAAAVGVVAVLPLAAGWPLWTALLLTAAASLAGGAGAALVDRDGRSPAVVAGCAAALAVLASSWALATEAGTLAFLGVLAPAAAIAAAASRTPWLRRGCAAVAAGAVLGESAATVVAAGGGAPQAGFAVAVAAGAVLVAGARWRQATAEGPVVESLGLAGLVLGALLAAEDGGWLAAALTAAVPMLLLAAVRPARGVYRWCGAAVAVAATWAWLTVADVTLVEAYTLPAAAAALVAGVVARRGRTQPSSWLALGPGLAVALLPSLGLVIDQGGSARPLLLTGGALLVVLAGARARLQAPLVLGAVTLVGLGVDAVLPVAAQLPRWVTIGAVGLLLLWLGATTERRLTQLRELRRRLQDLEQDGTFDAPQEHAGGAARPSSGVD